jgi:hypothetical protein
LHKILPIFCLTVPLIEAENKNQKIGTELKSDLAKNNKIIFIGLRPRSVQIGTVLYGE